MTGNIDEATVAGFGDEWTRFDQQSLPADERRRIFDDYFSVFPWDRIGRDAVGADIGCGSGRWALVMAPRVGTLHCVDPSDAIEIAATTCRGHSNVSFHRTGVDALPFEDGSLDFAYSLGVLHHVPDTAAAIRSVASKLRSGAPLLLYLYYAFDNRPAWFRWLWRVTDVVRRVVSRSPHPLRYAVSQVIAATVYWPLAAIARIADRLGILPASFPLASYRDKSFYTMRTDALDRFGTRLEQRFTRQQIREMMRQAGCRDLVFSDRAPYWCVAGIRE
jgi:SAM-dependent methyltransferase